MPSFKQGDIIRVPFLYTDRPAPSVIRPCKLATIEARHAEPLGRIGPDLMRKVEDAVRGYLGFR